ncbi:MAG: hypothetical protein HXX08_20790 [Chloroflexi bacterium]|uniref:Uncharacterized protein n=1 Tax=Candidatus Chlorohelix allophototropha TaxID=3003348 RepID=A0A8T7M838_9CHLR|nr:hypothetical protein [Chloroflexota bacterium]WJW68234.1 hypothetical protein OZ401_003841 [Chloroflexota bacterium L227-S17]
MSRESNYRLERFRDTADFNLKVVSTLDIESDTQVVWSALLRLANIGGISSKNQVESKFSPFSSFLQVLSPLNDRNRASRLTEIEPESYFSWEAQCKEFKAHHTWSILPTNSGTHLSVEVVFEGMTLWYFNVMGVEQKIRRVSELLLYKVREVALSENFNLGVA